MTYDNTSMKQVTLTGDHTECAACEPPPSLQGGVPIAPPQAASPGRENSHSCGAGVTLSSVQWGCSGVHELLLSGLGAQGQGRGDAAVGEDVCI